ncbi:hypothetical protein ACFQS3_21515 [Glycomyces mayteni]|uniref:Tetracyclin repressor-like C-terminal domain-containing protein n=1 Tax=Glycomyces mayteni TaxID=543887 RepID=A0ABW2DGH9_9ACTN|nr:hypothetical protein GCM10025732_08590 [Glycomyces mayteni]
MTETDMWRRHLEYGRDQGRVLPGDPEILAAAMGSMHSMLGYAVNIAQDRDLDDDTLTDLLHHSLAGPASDAGSRDLTG